MLRRILVPLDGSALAEAILQHVRRLLMGPEQEVSLLWAVPDEAHAPEAWAYLQRLQERLGAEGVRVLADVVVERDPAQAILEAAAARADLVCMSSHGRSGVRRLLRGGVAGACAPGSRDSSKLGSMRLPSPRRRADWRRSARSSSQLMRSSMP